MTASKSITEEFMILTILANFGFLYLLRHSLKKHQLCLEIQALSTGEVAQWVRAPLAKSDNLSLSRLTYMVEGEN